MDVKMTFQIKSVRCGYQCIIEENVRTIHTKTVYAAERSFKLYAHKHGYTYLRRDGTLLGGYYVNPETGDALVVEPML